MPQFLKKAVASALFLFLHLVFYRDILILFLVTGGKALFCRAFYFPSFFQPYHGVQKIPVAGLQGLFRLLLLDVCSFSSFFTFFYLSLNFSTFSSCSIISTFFSSKAMYLKLFLSVYSTYFNSSSLISL